ncbi:MAG: hypothetical protein PHF99_07730 [Bacteroidales bacterium]|nr:hypothetical protein [Bacteroidales bacterium]
MKTFIILMVIFSLIGFSSCDFDKEPPPTSEEVVTALSDYALASKIFSDSFNSADDAAKDADEQLSGKKTSKNTYPIVTVSPFDLDSWPKIIVLDYGEENYFCIDGRYRKGIINIEISDFYQNEYCEMDITYDDFYQNNHKVDGYVKIINLGENDNNNLVYSVEVTDGIVTTPEGLQIYYEQSTTREWTEGRSTPLEPCDDVYLIEGEQSGTSSNDIDYVLTTAEALDVLICCKWVRKGLLNVDIEGLNTITIDYGYDTGGCDNQASVIIGGNSYPIIME